MLEKQVRLASELLAREVNRRKFLKSAGGAIVSGVVALAAGPNLGGQDRSAHAAPRIPDVANCSPPGPYCNLDGVNEPNGCRGASCFEHFANGMVLACRLDTMYQVTGCWTTLSANEYWTCCDCICTGNVTCGCAQYGYGTGVFPD